MGREDQSLQRQDYSEHQRTRNPSPAIRGSGLQALLIDKRFLYPAERKGKQKTPEGVKGRGFVISTKTFSPSKERST